MAALNANESTPIGNLPPELIRSIVSVLDPVDSVCFGLTCKAFYAVHRAIHGTVKLTQQQGYEHSVNKSYVASLGKKWVRISQPEWYLEPIIVRPFLYDRLWTWYCPNYEYFPITERLRPTTVDPLRRLRSIKPLPLHDQGSSWGRGYNIHRGCGIGWWDRWGDRDVSYHSWSFSFGF